MPRISVVMPSYNQGHFIREAIDSILSQEGVDVELIVMDGGSDDGTVDTLRSYGDQLTFTSGPDEGQSWAINEGMRRTTEDIVCWLNSDDLFRPGALQTVLEVFESDPEVEFVTGAGRNIAGDGTLIGDVGAQPARLWELIHHRNFFNQPSCFMKRDLWFDVGGLNEDLDYVMDWDLWIRFGCAKSVFVDVQLSDNRSYDDNKTNSGGQARLTEIEQMVATYTRARGSEMSCSSICCSWSSSSQSGTFATTWRLLPPDSTRTSETTTPFTDRATIEGKRGRPSGV